MTTFKLPSNNDLQKQVDDLTLKVDKLERRLPVRDIYLREEKVFLVDVWMIEEIYYAHVVQADAKESVKGFHSSNIKMDAIEKATEYVIEENKKIKN